ncbi:MAG: histidine phosphatase family protein, partial [Acidimicrobiia bacterium]
SDLARARQTAAYVEKGTGLEARLDPRLREFDVGERTGMTMAEFAAVHPDEHAAWVRDRRAELPGAEETTEVLARALPAYDDVLAGLPPGGTAVVVTHGAALKVSVLALLGWPQGHHRQLEGLDNCAVAVIEQEPSDGARRLVAWNLRPDFVPDEPAR